MDAPQKSYNNRNIIFDLVNSLLMVDSTTSMVKVSKRCQVYINIEGHWASV